MRPRPLLIVHPRAAASLDEAHAAIEAWEFYSRKRLDQSQRLAVELMMAETADRMWAAPTTGRCVSRQNGKGDEVEVPEFWGILNRGEVVLHTTHGDGTAKAAHERMVALVEGHRDLRNRVSAIRYANGFRAVEMKGDNGGQALYRTRTPSTGRGLDDISRLVVDEAQHAQEEQLASATNIVLANPNPQINLAGSAGILGRSAWWWQVRLRAAAGDDDGFAYLEHSAEVLERVDGRPVFVAPFSASDPEVEGSELLVKAMLAANPAMHASPARITETKLRQQLKLNGLAKFARENLGVWDPPPVERSAGAAKLDAEAWAGVCLDQRSSMVGRLVLGVDADEGLSQVSIGAAGRRRDGLKHVELVEVAAGSIWLETRLRVLLESQPVAAVAVDTSGPMLSLVPLLERVCEAAKVDLVRLSSSKVRAACAGFDAEVRAGQVRHLGDVGLSSVALAAKDRRIGDGWAWERRNHDVSPLVAVTVAAAVLDGVSTEERRSAYEDHGLSVV